MKTLAYISGAIGLIVFLALLFTLPLLWLWNWLMPAIFGLTKITFWQALGLSFLAHILFRSEGGSNSERCDSCI